MGVVSLRYPTRGAVVVSEPEEGGSELGGRLGGDE